MTYANVLVPSIGRSPYAAGLLHTLTSDPGVRTVQVVDNQEGEGLKLRKQFKHPKIEWHSRKGSGLYKIWSDFVVECSSYQPVTDIAVILNDDVVLQPSSVTEMCRGMYEHPGMAIVGFDPAHPEACHYERMRPATGTYRANGIPGFAFAVRPLLVGQPLVDPEFEWWGGDDDMVFTVCRTLEMPCAVAVGVGVGHPEPSTSFAYMAESLGPAIERDRERLLRKWGETW